ncbi:fluoride efflux transporter FluC [Streptococcus sp. zg-JUN1979]|uniref:fluoride efflux transporter FluC n=1 Tax=Streptococcus sp. zg-JUN1979 TaxID=3391450 RepID=UPI0039A47809
MTTGIKYLLIGLGAALGAAVRWLCETIIGKAISDPFAILCVNVAGCFIIAAVSAMVMKKRMSQAGNKFLTTGFCGGLTTFSSFASGIESLMSTNHLLVAFCYVVLNMILGLMAVAFGFYVMLGNDKQEER